MAKHKNTNKQHKQATSSSKKQAKNSKHPKQKKANRRTKKTTTAWWKDKKILVPLLAILAITFVVFYPSIGNEFTNWDDQDYVYENPYISNLTFDRVVTFFSQPIAFNYHPLTMLSLAINYHFSELNATPYHLTNLIFHLLATLFVFLFTYKLSRNKLIVAIFVAFLFGIHPMHVESVAWIAERKDVLYGFFFAWGLWTYLFYLETKATKFYVYTFLLFLLSCLSKPAAVTFPLALLLIDWYWNKLDIKKLDTKLLLNKIPFFILSVIFGVITVKAQVNDAISAFDTYTIPERIMFASYGAMYYITQLFVPLKLSTLHPYPKDTASLSVFFYIAPIAFAILLGLLAYSWKHTKVAIFGMFFYLATIALTLQFVTVGGAIVSERYTYVPYIGLLFVLGMGIQYLLDNKKLGANTQYITLGIVGIWALGLSYVSFDRCSVWENPLTLWTDVISKYPKADAAYLGLGNYYRKEKKLDKALANYDKAIELNPDDYKPYNDRGNTYFDLRKDKEAIQDFEKALSLKPTIHQTFNNLGSVYARSGNYAKGLENFNKAIEINTTFVDAYLNRAILYTLTQKYDLAKKDYDFYISYKPNFPKTYYWRARNAFAQKNYSVAIQDFTKAIQLQPNSKDYYYNRSKTYFAMGNKSQALADAKKAQQLGMQIEASYLQSLQ